MRRRRHKARLRRLRDRLKPRAPLDVGRRQRLRKRLEREEASRPKRGRNHRAPLGQLDRALGRETRHIVRLGHLVKAIVPRARESAARIDSRRPQRRVEGAFRERTLSRHLMPAPAHNDRQHAASAADELGELRGVLN